MSSQRVFCGTFVSLCSACDGNIIGSGSPSAAGGKAGGPGPNSGPGDPRPSGCFVTGHLGSGSRDLQGFAPLNESGIVNSRCYGAPPSLQCLPPPSSGARRSQIVPPALPVFRPAWGAPDVSFVLPRPRQAESPGCAGNTAGLEAPEPGSAAFPAPIAHGMSCPGTSAPDAPFRAGTRQKHPLPNPTSLPSSSRASATLTCPLPCRGTCPNYFIRVYK